MYLPTAIRVVVHKNGAHGGARGNAAENYVSQSRIRRKRREKENENFLMRKRREEDVEKLKKKVAAKKPGTKKSEKMRKVLNTKSTLTAN